HFPTPENQSVETWDMALGPQVPDFGPDTILIGHSCGATYMLHILESLSSPIRASVFVSGFAEKLGDDYFDNQNETFINHDFDWDKIRRNAGKITLFYGDNDPYVSRDAAENFAKNLGAPLTVIPNGGHLNTEFGYTEFPKLLEVLK
ncbi:MAG: alpha/beta hydrolase, partial [Rickettsiales bacterium]|nr:alpha/beta hydrolase [Rickettsiales bacterium]